MASEPPASRPPSRPSVFAPGQPRDLRGHANGRAATRAALTVQRRRRGRPKAYGSGGFKSDMNALEEINQKFDDVTEDKNRPALRKEVAEEFGMDPATLWRACRDHHLVGWPPERGPGFIE